MRILGIAIYLILFFLMGTVTNFKIISMMKKDPKEGLRLGNNTVRNAFRQILLIAGVRRIVKGVENLPLETALYVSNHRGYFDILTTHVTINRPLGYVAKAEMIHIPFLSQWMRNIGCLFLNRQDNKAALKTIIEGVNLLKNDYCSLYIFPEGTRGHSDEVAPFKKGSFKMAEKANVPIVPIGIVGSDKVFENNGWFRKVRGKKVYINIGEPIYLDQLDSEQRKHINSYVHQMVTDLIQEMKEQYAIK